MQQFGYVPQGDNTSDFLFTPSGLKEHIKQVQKFGSIPQTGEIDEKTIQVRSRSKKVFPFRQFSALFYVKVLLGYMPN